MGIAQNVGVIIGRLGASLLELRRTSAPVALVCQSGDFVKPEKIYILGIETSCDETAASVVCNGRQICSSVVASQTALHEKYGGVVPEIASRAHVENILPIVTEAIEQAGIMPEQIDAVAVAREDGEADHMRIDRRRKPRLAPEARACWRH